ncbi:hypothetical protein ACOV11_28195, partial [Vibrio natriegens]
MNGEKVAEEQKPCSMGVVIDLTKADNIRIFWKLYFGGMTEYLLLLVGTVLVNNFVLVKFLGLCPFMG